MRQILFASFRLDPGNQCLWREGKTVALTPKAFSVLSVLLERAGQLLTKEELLRAVWPDTLVSDASLKVCIGEIRKALGDQPKAPRFIETRHRRGYRFIAETTETADSLPSAIAIDAELQAMPSALRGQQQVLFVTEEPADSKTVLVEAFVHDIPTEQGNRRLCEELQIDAAFSHA